MQSLILWSLAVSLVINLVLFVIAFYYQSDKLTDASYAASFLALAVFALFKTSAPNIYSYLIFLMVDIWAFRIGIFLVNRVLKVGKDKRFDSMRSDFLAFGRFWLLQGITVWIIMLAASMAIYRAGNIGWLFFVGLVIWLNGLLIEAVADQQKFEFREQKGSEHPWIDKGLWAKSRHPNYFGEISVWVGIYVASFEALSSEQRVLALVSPLFITLLLTKVSGVPILEKSANERWGSLKAYKDYKARTRLLIPLPKKEPR
ncbi:MAG TPA: DUF1295 domain-containing protein [Candidatus Sulfotelmatobacter sp.]|nr:DUF1295 domain-containing protein [Candidatus Sulfotelmatobacter sp.]